MNSDEFSVAFLAKILLKGMNTIPLGDPAVEASFRRVVDALSREAISEMEKGNEAFALEILGVVEDLRPDPNSGAMHRFWSALRRQQPLRARVPNPTYKDLELNINKAEARQSVSSLRPEWRNILDQSVEKVEFQLAK